MNDLHFFLGANTPIGFVSFYDEITKTTPDSRNFLIKGGPGTGKSSLMKRIREEFAPSEDFPESIHCSSDPDSLDALILPNAKTALADATRPTSSSPSTPAPAKRW